MQSSAISQILNAEYDSYSKLKDAQVIFLIGGPGSGKGLLCRKLSQKYGFNHISTGDLFRREIKAKSEAGLQLSEALANRNRPKINNIVFRLLIDEMVNEIGKSKVFLVDGYLRQVDMAYRFEDEIVPCEMAIFLDASDDVMRQRVLQRRYFEEREEDNPQTLGIRLDYFRRNIKGLLGFYRRQAKLKVINADMDEENVFQDAQRLINMTFFNWRREMPRSN
jgi:adenylate kinase family enzyme